MIAAILLGLLGLGLSAFFSGSEIGFYRVARMRLVLDAMGGDLVARGLVWLINRPSLFIATALVGNNFANYLVSLATVIAITSLGLGTGHTSELIASLLMTPVVFVYGELLPKNLSLQAPNRLLRKTGPLFLVFVILFLPFSGLLWLLNQLLSRLVKETPERMRLAIARRELRRVLDEGHDVGILHPAQRQLAQGIFALAKQSVTMLLIPLIEVPRARAESSKADVLRLAQRMSLAAVAIEDAGRLVGYVRVIDLKLAPGDEIGVPRPLLRISQTDTHLDALMRLHAAKESLALVVDGTDHPLGILTESRLRQPLLRSVG